VTVAAYARPASVEEAVALLQEHGDDAHLLAGGTALTLLRKQGLVDPALVVDLGRIAGLGAVSAQSDGGVRIGATATLREVETSPIVLERAPALAHVIGRVATIRIRNQATLGGNLAHGDPAQDPPPILLALDAELEVEGPNGTRRQPLDGFFVDVFETVLESDEVVTAILVPPVQASSRVGYEKFLPRTADDYATVSVAARLDVGGDGRVADARVALGSVAAVPMRLPAAEAALRGLSLTEVVDGGGAAAAAAVTDGVDPVDDVRGSAAYKREMAGVWTARLLRRLATGVPADGPADRADHHADRAAGDGRMRP
jgi:aerobic carbon-monoxide dehydrogenase medium subunit